MSKQNDLLRSKQNSLEGFQACYTASVSMITGAINSLKQASERITSDVAEIESYQQELERTRGDLLRAKEQNDAVAANLSALLAL